MKRFVAICLLLLLTLACNGRGQSAATPIPELSATPEPTEEPVVVPSTPEVKNTPIPVPTPTPVPTPEPTPTPTPSPTPVPYDASLEAQKRKALLLGTESLTFVSTRGNNPSILKEPVAGSKRIYPHRASQYVWQYEWIVLDTVQTEYDKFYHVRAVGSDAEGYITTRSVQESLLTAPESTYAIMVRANGLVYCGRTQDASIVAHADYEVVRVFGVTDTFACILTAEGKTGYAELGQLRFVDRETFEDYLHRSCETPDCTFDRDELPTVGEEYLDQPFENSAEFVYHLLRNTGLHFNEVYYRYYQKPLEEATLYPHSLYRDAVYNSLLFKLFNSSGMHVTANGEETEWAYIDSYEEIEPGDLLFFSSTAGKGKAVLDSVEVVVHGKYSGDVSDCGIYLGENLMLSVRTGKVAEVEIDESMQEIFDSARRIYAHVYDEKAHFVEIMISMIYDRLGTPYNNFQRLGDKSYDCSGIINWVLRAFDYSRYRNPEETPIEITATGFGHQDALYSPTHTITLTDTGITSRDKESLAMLQRGDLVLLLNEKRTKIGHIMVYLGNNTVIHSTQIEGNYRGTLVAQFRNHLQSLYNSSRRIASITPNK